MHPKRFFSIFSALFVSTAPSWGAIVLTIEEVGADVVASYSGTLDTTGMGFREESGFSEFLYLDPAKPDFSARVNESGGTTSIVLLSDTNWGTPWNTTPTAFGEGGQTSATDFSLNYANLFFFSGRDVGLAPSFESGDSLSGSLTFGDENFATMGITIGTYTAEFGSGDTLTIHAIPEPNSYGLLLGGVGLATALFLRRRRHSSAV
jgi:hypothetical protein